MCFIFILTWTNRTRLTSTIQIIRHTRELSTAVREGDGLIEWASTAITCDVARWNCTVYGYNSEPNVYTHLESPI